MQNATNLGTLGLDSEEGPCVDIGLTSLMTNSAEWEIHVSVAKRLQDRWGLNYAFGRS